MRAEQLCSPFNSSYVKPSLELREGLEDLLLLLLSLLLHLLSALLLQPLRERQAVNCFLEGTTSTTQLPGGIGDFRPQITKLSVLLLQRSF